MFLNLSYLIHSGPILWISLPAYQNCQRDGGQRMDRELCVEKRCQAPLYTYDIKYRMGQDAGAEDDA